MEPAILGISLTRRLMGLAVIRDGILLDWQTCRLGAIGSLDTGLIPVIEKYNIRAIAMKGQHKRRGSEEPWVTEEKLRDLAAELGIYFSAYDMETLLSDIPPGHPDKMALAGYLALRFPELQKTYHQERRNGNSYHIKMFEAVACAHLHELMGQKFVLGI